MLDVLTHMRLAAVVVAAVLVAAPVRAGAQPATPIADASGGQLPVSLDKIKTALELPPAEPLRGLSNTPNFKIAVEEKQRVKLEDLINSLDFKSGPVPPGGLYAFEQQRQMFPAVDNPLRQPYSEFSQPELLTILAENLSVRYLASRAAGAITSAERARAEAQARDDVARAVVEYCAAQPRGGAGIQICANPGSIR